MKNATSPSAPLVCTIGHSNRAIDVFIDLLKHNQVTHIIDVRTVRGVEVEDIIGPKDRKPHKLTSFAHVEGTQITYPPDERADGVSNDHPE